MILYLKKKYKNLNIIEVKNIKDGLEKVEQNELFGFVYKFLNYNILWYQ